MGVLILFCLLRAISVRSRKYHFLNEESLIRSNARSHLGQGLVSVSQQSSSLLCTCSERPVVQVLDELICITCRSSQF